LLRAVAFPALGLVLLAVLLAFSRGALLAAALGAAVWFVAVPRRLRGAALLGTGLAGALALMAWAFSQDALTKDGAALSARSSAGTALGLLLVLLTLVLLVVGLGVQRLADRRPPTELERRRAGTAVLAALALVPVIGLVAMATSSRGLAGSISKSWDDLTNPSKTPSNGPTRLTAAGNIRAKYWSDAWKVFEHEPVIGAGAGAFHTARTRYRIDSVATRHAHGYVVQTLADLGLVGLAIALTALVAWLTAASRAVGLETHTSARLVSAVRRRPPPQAEALRVRWLALPVTPERMALVTLVSVVVVFGVHSAIDWTWIVPGTAITALACAGYVAGRGPFGGIGDSVRGPRWATRVAIAMGLMGLALIVSWAIWQPQRSATADESSLSQLSKDHVDLAYVDAVKARHRNPLSVEPLYTQATIENSVGRRGAARQALVRAVRLQPANADTWQHLGNYDLAALGRPRAAVDELRAALYLDPKAPAIQAQFVAALRALAAAQQAERRPPGATKRGAPSKATARPKSGAATGGLSIGGAKPSQLRTPSQLRSTKPAPVAKPAPAPKPARTPKQVQTPKVDAPAT
ncbi:MAG: O-antigen ligase family protein, partial [Actinomycetota bacterium]|nr:O-antigen ligase family protein [Actinomycetota bacterium]